MRSPERTANCTPESTRRSLRQFHRLLELEAPFPLCAGGFDDRQPFEHLQPALRLARLRGLRAEAVDEFLQVRRRAFVLTGRRILLAQLLEVRRLERAVVARIAADRVVADVPDGLRDAVEKLAVVRDHEHGRRLALQPGLEPDDRIEVEVVGRLVEQQQVSRSQQCTRQRQPVAPAAGEGGHRPRGVRFGEAQAVQHRPRFRGDCAFIQFRERGQSMREIQVVVLLLGQREFGARRGERGVAGQDVVERGDVRAFDVLRHVGDALVRRRFQFSRVDRKLAEDGGKQRRLAAAVRAHESDALTRRRDERHTAVQRARAAGNGDIDQSEHRGTRACGRDAAKRTGATGVLPGAP
jgi:hypothetical protein